MTGMPLIGSLQHSRFLDCFMRVEIRAKLSTKCHRIKSHCRNCLERKHSFTVHGPNFWVRADTLLPDVLLLALLFALLLNTTEFFVVSQRKELHAVSRSDLSKWLQPVNVPPWSSLLSVCSSIRLKDGARIYARTCLYETKLLAENYNQNRASAAYLPKSAQRDKMSAQSGKIQTVLDLIEPECLGRTLTHEHLSMKFDFAFIPPRNNDTAKSDTCLTLTTLGWIRYSNKANLTLNDGAAYKAIVSELHQFKKEGGGSIVECTTFGIDRNVQCLKEMSSATGVHIIAGTGFYVEQSQEPQTLAREVDYLEELMIRELTVGCMDAPDVKCGIIGEIGCNWPLRDFEKGVLRAAANAQSATGCPVSVHPGRNVESPFEIVRTFQEAGGDAKKLTMCHLDRTMFKHEDFVRFAELGSFCEFDLFGTEISHYQLNEMFDMPSDAQRIQEIAHLIQAGFGDRILMSHDIHTKHRLCEFGGHGFSHILLNVVPKMLKRGITAKEIDMLLVKNPQSWLQFQ